MLLQNGKYDEEVQMIRQAFGLAIGALARLVVVVAQLRGPEGFPQLEHCGKVKLALCGTMCERGMRGANEER